MAASSPRAEELTVALFKDRRKKCLTMGWRFFKRVRLSPDLTLNLSRGNIAGRPQEARPCESVGFGYRGSRRGRLDDLAGGA